jgi:hypothetical protein
MKKSARTLLFVAVGLSAASADDTVKEAMKKYFKAEGAPAKKAGTKGVATTASTRAGFKRSIEPAVRSST